jgi:hypothetical protein
MPIEMSRRVISLRTLSRTHNDFRKLRPLGRSERENSSGSFDRALFEDGDRAALSSASSTCSISA